MVDVETIPMQQGIDEHKDREGRDRKEAVFDPMPGFAEGSVCQQVCSTEISGADVERCHVRHDCPCESLAGLIGENIKNDKGEQEDGNDCPCNKAGQQQSTV